MTKLLLTLLVLILAGCATDTAPGTKNTASADGVLVSHLTRTQVKEIAAARARKNGLVIEATVPWEISLSADGPPHVWKATPHQPGEPPASYWIVVNDETGQADFIGSALDSQKLPAGGDWLSKIQEELSYATFPMQVEELLRRLEIVGADAGGPGGTTTDGRLYFEYTLRNEHDRPARFELRCYYTMPDGATGLKMATGAEVYYIDAKLNYYLLSNANSGD